MRRVSLPNIFIFAAAKYSAKGPAGAAGAAVDDDAPAPPAEAEDDAGTKLLIVSVLADVDDAAVVSLLADDDAPEASISPATTNFGNMNARDAEGAGVAAAAAAAAAAESRGCWGAACVGMGGSGKDA